MARRRRRLAEAAKRAGDLVGASVGLVCFAPVMAAAAAAIAADIGRPVFFTQRRPGRDGVPFTMFKFRTMREPSPGESRFTSDANRLTRLGRFLRKTSIDELPELLKVVRGEMSLVGPRPLLMEYLDRYTPEQARRHEVRPGITGWAQVNGRQHIPFSKRLELDVWYADNWSAWLDARIILMTVGQAIIGSGVESGQKIEDVDDIGLYVRKD